MSWTQLSGNKECLARKKHRCDICDSPIQKGEKQITRSGVSEDGFYRMHMHPECEKYSSEWEYYDWETHCPGDVSRIEILNSLKPSPTETEEKR